MKLNEIHIRDPYVLPYGGKYYMYGTRGKEIGNTGTGLDVFISDDLENWHGPVEIFKKPENFWADSSIWAPEVYFYKEKFYMFVTFRCKTDAKRVQILSSSSPEGPFEIYSDPITPENWYSLDGTFYIDKNNNPYMIFCHEWIQKENNNIGKMCAVRLSDDLKNPVGDPVELFSADVTPWRKKGADEKFITDGPFMYRMSDKRLVMIWSSVTDGAYCESVSYSSNGDIDGKWTHSNKLLFDSNGGHGMIFKDYDGNLKFVCHQPNTPPRERAVMITITEKDILK